MAQKLRLTTIFLQVVVFASLYIQVVYAVKECKKIDQCRCSTDEGEINIWSLAGKGSNVPRFPHIRDSGSSQSEYLWNPCNAWVVDGSTPKENKCTSDTAVCQASTPVGPSGTQPWYYRVGKQSSASFEFDSAQSACILTYTGTGQGGGPGSVVKIRLSCSKETDDPVVEAMQSSDQTNFETVLTHKCACPGVCTAGLSNGSILVIVFCCLVFIYLVSGILFNKYHKGATGKEVIPNYSFWSDFPSLVKVLLVHFSPMFHNKEVISVMILQLGAH